MKILIVGAGKIGTSVAKILSDEGHDVTVIDKSAEKIDLLSNELDVICVVGSATNADDKLLAAEYVKFVKIRLQDSAIASNIYAEHPK